MNDTIAKLREQLAKAEADLEAKNEKTIARLTNQKAKLEQRKAFLEARILKDEAEVLTCINFKLDKIEDQLEALGAGEDQ